MDYPLKSVDAEGKSLGVGDTVLFKKAPENLLRDLPADAQSAIVKQIGKRMKVIAFDDYGYAEMEFKSADGAFRTIWVETKELYKC